MVTQTQSRSGSGLEALLWVLLVGLLLAAGWMIAGGDVPELGPANGHMAERHPDVIASFNAARCDCNWRVYRSLEESKLLWLHNPPDNLCDAAMIIGAITTLAGVLLTAFKSPMWRWEKVMERDRYEERLR